MSRHAAEPESYSLGSLNHSSAPPSVRSSIGPYTPFKPQEPDDVPGETVPGHGALGWFDVFSLIVNKMIGTGIFQAPATVFMLTGSKRVTLGLFACGWVYTILSMAMYLDYAAAWPYNGGELNYLAEVFAHNVEFDNDATAPHRVLNRVPSIPANGSNEDLPKPPVWTRLLLSLRSGIWQSDPWTRARTWLRKFSGDGLLPYTLYSVVFYAVFNSGTNSMQTGRMVLQFVDAAQNRTESFAPGWARDNGPHDVHRDLVRFIGVFVLLVICLLQYFSPGFGRKLNKAFAVMKILFLVALIAVAADARKYPLEGADGKQLDRSADWGEEYGDRKPLLFAKAFLAVLFSFEGWENATFVAGEIPLDRPKDLRRGFLGAIFLVGALYLAVVGAVLNSVSWYALEGNPNINLPPLLTGNGVHAKIGWSVVEAISALGSLNAIIYTFSRVKQVIGQAEVLPWSKIWKRDDRLERGDRNYRRVGVDDFVYKSPEGGLIVHFTMTVVVIAISASIQSTTESISLPGMIQTYIHCFILMILGAFYWRLDTREAALSPPRRRDENSEAEHSPEPRGGPKRRRKRKEPSRPSKANTTFGQLFCVVVFGAYVLVNLAILVINPFPPYAGSDGSNVAFPGWGFPVVLGGLLIVGTVYYALVFGAAERLYSPSWPGDDGEEGDGLVVVREEGLFRRGSWWDALGWVGVRCEVRKDRGYNDKLERVYRFGRRWRVVYYLPGDRGLDQGVHRPVLEGDGSAAQGGTAQVPTMSSWKLFLYWVFGGDRLKETPRENLGNMLR